MPITTYSTTIKSGWMDGWMDMSMFTFVRDGRKRFSPNFTHGEAETWTSSVP